MFNESQLAYAFGRESRNGKNEEEQKGVQVTVLEQLLGTSLESVSFDMDEDGKALTSMTFKGTLKELAEALQSVMVDSLERQSNDMKEVKERELRALRDSYAKELEDVKKRQADNDAKKAPIEAKAEIIGDAGKKK